MQNKKRKGFTIVELVIVIVIIGVLAAVLIPTFGSLIQKANESADKQTVYQMNIIISSELIENEELIKDDGTLDIEKFKAVLEKNGLNIENLEPTSEDLEFMWDKVNKVVILVRPGEGDNSPTLIYPDVDNLVWGNIVSLGSSSSDTPPEGTLISNDEDLAKAIEDPNVSCIVLNNTDGLTISKICTIDRELTINLNGCDLTIADLTPEEDDPDYIVTIQGSLTIKDTNVNNTGKLIISEPSYNEYANNYAGIDVGDNGVYPDAKLIIEGITVEGRRTYNIENYANISITDTDFYVTGGNGLYNAGSNSAFEYEYTIVNTNFFIGNNGVGVYNRSGGTIKITGTEEGRNKFVASGTGVCSFCNNGGTATINGTVFEEKEGDAITYSSSYASPIYISGGTADLTNVTVGECESAIGSVFAINTVVTIDGGTYNDFIKCTGGALVTVKEGTGDNTFNFNGTSFADLLESESDIKTNLTNQDAVSAILITDTNSSTTIMLNDGKDNFSVLANKLNPNYSADNSATIPTSCTVTIYQGAETNNVDVNIVIEGTLTINGVGGSSSNLEDEGGSITINSEGTLALSGINQHINDQNTNDQPSFISGCIVNNGGTFTINGNPQQ